MKKLYLGLILATFLVLTLSCVSADTVILTKPANSGTIIGDYELRADVQNLTGGEELTGNFTCFFYAKSASTANSTWASLGNSNNNTVLAGFSNHNWTNLSISSANGLLLENSNDYIFNATCKNLSATMGSDLSTSVTLDNSDPATPRLLIPVSGDINSTTSLTIQGTVAGKNTTGCTLRFIGGSPIGSDTKSMTHSGDTCTYSATSMSEGTYQYLITATDGITSVNSAATPFTIDIKTGGPAGASVWLQEQGKIAQTGGKTFSITGVTETIKQNPIISIIIFIIIVAVIVKIFVK